MSKVAYKTVMRRLRIAGLALAAVSVLLPAQAAERLPVFRDDTILKAVLTATISQAYAQME